MRSALRLALAAALALASPAAAQRASLTLQVVEAETGRPVADARVSVSGVGRSALTDAQGRAHVAGVPAGRRMVSVARIGYATESAAVEFARGDVEGDVELRPQAVALDELAVRSGGRVAKLRDNGFYQRQLRGMGAYMDRGQIARRNATQMIDVFRQVRGFEIAYTPRGQPMLQTSRGVCRARPLIYVDGIQMADPDGRGDPSDFVHPDQVEAIEAYAGMGAIPAEYNVTGSACGVILIWTRSTT